MMEEMKMQLRDLHRELLIDIIVKSQMMTLDNEDIYTKKVFYTHNDEIRSRTILVCRWCDAISYEGGPALNCIIQCQACEGMACINSTVRVSIEDDFGRYCKLYHSGCINKVKYQKCTGLRPEFEGHDCDILTNKKCSHGKPICVYCPCSCK